MGKGWLLPLMSKKRFILLNIIKFGKSLMEYYFKVSKLSIQNLSIRLKCQSV